MCRLGPACIALCASLLVGSSGQGQSVEPLAVNAKRALAEARAADAQVAKLEKAADQAQDEVERIRAQQAAAAEAMQLRVFGSAPTAGRLLPGVATRHPRRAWHETATLSALTAVAASWSVEG
jgi:hypothetical protein